MRSATRLLALLALAAPTAGGAQEAHGFVFGAGAGGTYYCIVSRCNAGTTLVGVAGYAPARSLLIHASVRTHHCFDCDRFLMAEGGLQLRHAGRSLVPFVAAGAGWISDPEFMGDHVSPHVAVGAWIWPTRSFGLQLEVRGRRVSRGDALGEVSVVLARRIAPRTR